MEMLTRPLIIEPTPEWDSPHLTLADLRDFASQHPQAEWELWEGEIIEMPKPNPLHGHICAEVLFALMSFLRHHPQLGRAFGDNTEFAPTEDILVVPDASFISAAKLRYPYPQSFPFMPDLAVEVVSPGNSADEMARKTDQYLRYGSLMVWEVYPKEQFVRVYQQEQGQTQMRQYGLADRLENIAFLPGFSVDVRQLFPAPLAG
jgi:Uma2 family endonuclease